MDEKEFDIDEYIRKSRLIKQQIQKEREEFSKKMDAMTEEERVQFLIERDKKLLAELRKENFKSVEILTKKDDEEN